MKRTALVAGALLAGVALGLAGKIEYAAAPAAAPLAAVVAARTGDAHIGFSANGQLVALRQVSVRAPMASAVSQVFIHEGDMVRAGQLLFTLEGRNAHARITAPISGAAGALKMRAGSAARRNPAAPLLTLIQFDPIGFEFSLPQLDADRIVAARADASLGVSLELPGGATVDGKLDLVVEPVAAGATTTKFMAVFPNHDQALWPGAFAKVRLSAGVTHDAAALPAQAVHGGTNGRFVYVVDDDGRLSSKAVTLLQESRGGAVVLGLTSGQLVVLEDGIAPGTRVRVAQ